MTDSIQVQEQLIQDLGARVREVDAAISGKNQLVKEIELSLLEQQQKHSATLEEKERLNSIWQDVNRQQEQAIADSGCRAPAGAGRSWKAWMRKGSKWSKTGLPVRRQWNHASVWPERSMRQA